MNFDHEEITQISSININSIIKHLLYNVNYQLIRIQAPCRYIANQHNTLK